MLKISRILHAGYIFESKGIRIVFDPIFENPFSRNCHAFPTVRFDKEQIQNLKFDAVFISHYHDDHCSLESLNLLDRETPIYMFCIFEEIFMMIRNLGFKHVYALRLDAGIILGDFEITPRRALDEDVDSIFHIKTQGLNILNVVDSWIGYDTLALLAKTSWDLVLWPFQTMREIEVLSPKRATPPEGLPPEWIEQLKILNPKYIVPSSCQFQFEAWSWYNRAFFPIRYADFRSEIQALLPGTQVIRMNPGVSIIFDGDSIKPSASLNWVIPVGDQDVDYDFESVDPPSTAEIATHFGELSAKQMQRVLSYCEDDLLERYRSLDEQQGEYFKLPRPWKLLIYGHRGERFDFYYLVHRDRIEKLDPVAEQLGWITEVPATKLYAALENGESLTSMYMRINDEKFSPQIEAELAEADIVEDPLMRCLFEGVIGGYQAAQLRKLTPVAKDEGQQ